MRAAVAAFIFLGFSIPALAQVYQCKDASGHMNFSDRPCTSNQSGGLIERRRTDAEIYRERMQAAEANERKYQQRAAETQQQQMEMQQRMLNQQTHAFQQTPPNPSTTQACKEARKELEFVSSIRTISQDEKRMRTNAAITAVNASCGTTTELMQEPPKVIVSPHAYDQSPHPTVIGRCNGRNCFDTEGNSYRMSPNGRTLTSPQGKTCFGSGSSWNCN